MISARCDAMDGRPRSRQLVVLAGEAVVVDLLAEQLQRHPELFGLADRTAPVLLGVDDEHRLVDVADRPDRREALVLVGSLEVVHAVDRVECRRDVGRPLQRRRVVDRSLGAERPEPIAVVTGEPRGHEPAVRAAEHADAVGVAEVVAVECGVDDRKDVVDVDRSPSRTGHGRVVRTLDGLAPAGVPATAAAWVAEHHDEAGRGLHLELVEEVLAVLGVGTAVDVEQHGVALRLVEVGGPHDPGVDLVGAVGGAGGEVFPVEQMCGELVADVGASFVADVELGRMGGGLLGSGHDAAPGIERRHRHGAVGQRGRDERAVRGQPVQVRGPSVLGGGEQVGVRFPHRCAGTHRRPERPVEPGGDPADRGVRVVIAVERQDPHLGVLRGDARGRRNR